MSRPAPPASNVIRKCARIQRVHRRFDDAIVYQRDDRIDDFTILALGLLRVCKGQLVAGDFTVPVPDGKPLAILFLAGVNALGVDLAGAFEQNLVDRLGNVARLILERTQSLRRKKVALEYMPAIVDVLSAILSGKEIPRIDPHGTGHALGDDAHGNAALGSHDRLRLLVVRDRPLDDADPYPRHVKLGFTHLSDVLALNEPVVNALGRGLGCFFRFFYLLLCQVFDLERDLRSGFLVVLFRRLPHDGLAVAHDMALILQPRDEFRDRSWSEGEGLTVYRQRDFPELCSASIDIAGGKPDESRRANAVA